MLVRITALVFFSLFTSAALAQVKRVAVLPLTNLAKVEPGGVVAIRETISTVAH